MESGAKIGRDCVISKNICIDADTVVGDRVKLQNNVNVYYGVEIEHRKGIVMNIAVFAYDFPHVKSEEFLLNLIVKGIKITCVIAAPWVKLNFPRSIKRVKVKRNAALSPREISERFHIPYYVCPHNSIECEEILKENDIDFGIIAGARILKSNIINNVKIGILNLHPGIIPEVRGLDTLKWAIYDGADIGVTAHFIDARIDMGYIIDRRTIRIEEDDTFFDLSQKMSELELEMMLDVVNRIVIMKEKVFAEEMQYTGNYYKTMENDKELLLEGKLAEYIKKHVGAEAGRLFDRADSDSAAKNLTSHG